MCPKRHGEWYPSHAFHFNYLVSSPHFSTHLADLDLIWKQGALEASCAEDRLSEMRYYRSVQFFLPLSVFTPHPSKPLRQKTPTGSSSRSPESPLQCFLCGVLSSSSHCPWVDWSSVTSLSEAWWGQQHRRGHWGIWLPPEHLFLLRDQ